MAARNRLPPWHEMIRLPNGREVLVRPIRPDDAVPLRAGFPLLQPEEIRQRFLYSVKELSPEMAERLTHPDPRREFAIVAAEPHDVRGYRRFEGIGFHWMEAPVALGHEQRDLCKGSEALVFEWQDAGGGEHIEVAQRIYDFAGG